MPESSPNQTKNRLGSSGDFSAPQSLGSRATVPPSEPRSSRASFDVLDAQVDRPARLQMIVALILGLVLVAIPLYLWRRPRAEAITVQGGAGDAGVLPAVTAAATGTTEDKLIIGDPKIISCHDPGPKKTAPDQCDHVAEMEKAFAKSIEESSTCVPREAGGGTIIYVAEVIFGKKKLVSVGTPKEGRTLKSPKIAGACEKLVKAKLSNVPFDGAKHEHAKYRVSITATYPGAAKP